jgi:hypothetical protein
MKSPQTHGGLALYCGLGKLRAVSCKKKVDMSQYWVVGGEYKDTDFKNLAEGVELEEFGPFHTYEAARKEWQARNMAKIDNAMVRYRIVQTASSGMDS